jgi:hypothetical protein
VAISMHKHAFAASILLAATCMVDPLLSTPAAAQAAGMAGISTSETISFRAKVTAIDLPTRTVTLVDAQGKSQTLKVGDEVRNLPQVKAGDTVNVRYHTSVTYVLSPRGAKLPNNSMTAAGARAAPGQKPAGAVGVNIVASSTVVGVDLAGHTLQLIDPAGGFIRTASVTSPEGQQSMKMIKVGDTITGVGSESIAIAVEPAS